MEHLKVLFEEELGTSDNLYVDEGRVHIRERNWAPRDILEAFGPGTYDEVFRAWLADRKDTLLCKAEEILKQYDQKDRFSALKAAFKRNSVTPFVGAGLSISSGYPGWSAFLRRTRSHTNIPAESLDELLDLGDYEGAAQLLADDMGVAFNEEIENTFACDRELRGPVQLIPYLFSSPVATTNFDDVLKRCHESAGNAFVETISGADYDELRRHLGAGKPLLIKLHGKATSGRSRILTSNEYAAAYGPSGSLQDLVQILCSRTLLFIGCSLSVDRLVRAIEAYVSSNGHDRVPRHYALLAAPSDAELRRKRRADLAKCNIYPIWYPEDEHDESIESLLYLLAEGVVPL